MTATAAGESAASSLAAVELSGCGGRDTPKGSDTQGAQTKQWLVDVEPSVFQWECRNWEFEVTLVSVYRTFTHWDELLLFFCEFCCGNHCSGFRTAEEGARSTCRPCPWMSRVALSRISENLWDSVNFHSLSVTLTDSNLECGHCLFAIVILCIWKVSVSCVPPWIIIRIQSEELHDLVTWLMRCYAVAPRVEHERRKILN